MQIYECKNEYRGMLMLRMDIWGMSMLGVNVGMGECYEWMWEC